MSDQTRFHEGRLSVSQVMSDRPPVVPRGTTLVEVANVLSGNRYQHALVSDGGGRVIGVVSSTDVLAHLAGWSEANPDAWSARTVDTVMTTKFLTSTPDAAAEDVATVVREGDIRCVPVIEGDRLVGVMTPDDLLLSWNKLEPLLRQASVDALTELANRATFERRLEEEWDRARRERSPLGVILVDCDHFKQINDTCGHQTGDAVLSLVGACMKRHLRRYDVVARYGGDEFVALCCGCAPDHIEVPIGRLQHGVRQLSVPSEGGRRSITLSIGAAVVRDGWDALESSDLVAAADESLYESKRRGRDQAWWCEIDGLPERPERRRVEPLALELLGAES